MWVLPGSIWRRQWRFGEMAEEPEAVLRKRTRTFRLSRPFWLDTVAVIGISESFSYGLEKRTNTPTLVRDVRKGQLDSLGGRSASPRHRLQLSGGAILTHRQSERDFSVKIANIKYYFRTDVWMTYSYQPDTFVNWFATASFTSPVKEGPSTL